MVVVETLSGFLSVRNDHGVQRNTRLLPLPPLFSRRANVYTYSGRPDYEEIVVAQWCADPFEPALERLTW